MKIKYFSDTDTAFVEFADHDVAETKEINENIYIDLDISGNLVAMTVEHARQQASLPSVFVGVPVNEDDHIIRVPDEVEVIIALAPGDLTCRTILSSTALR
ncbi:MAG: hypothetical protein COW52_04600 [Nitrospirae bacterium CG17_big_fil_post_rev_8_21_14_2_50_50_9]|nr:MAG: hypothetical protein COW52_04600 [Nitrospirae bacterium CG17_big_fil_post_rev_8_21_14_2_50_50_9]PIW84164.1 MAG: hypothetical protein COZ95_11250 [Nitrospirae bacterium CG_4_8_14_3_um_filter_50_41]